MPARLIRWHSLWLVLALLLVTYATLTPGSSEVRAITAQPFWCLACGEFAGADMTTNVLLFIPLGFVLVLAGITWPRAFVIGTLLSCCIESAQHFGVPRDRVSSIADILANGAGALTGAIVSSRRRAWIVPTPQLAATLCACTALLVVVMLSVTSWALGRGDEAPGAVVPSALQFTPGFGWYHGNILSATYNGSYFAHTGDGPVILRTAPTGSATAIVVVKGRDSRDNFVPLLYVHDTQSSPADMIIGQHSNDAELRVRMNGAQLKLAAPDLVLFGAFEALPPDSVRTVAAELHTDWWRLSERHGMSSRNTTLHIGMALGWTLFQTVFSVWTPVGLTVSVLWLAALCAPLGYWCAMSVLPRWITVRDSASRTDRSIGGPRAIGIASMIAVTAALRFAPSLGHIAPATSSDFVRALTGYLFGLAVGGIVARYGAQSTPDLVHAQWFRRFTSARVVQ